jgi:hypothetical protein
MKSQHNNNIIMVITCKINDTTVHRAGGTGPVGQAKTGPLSSTNSVMIVGFAKAIYMNLVMITTISYT